MDRWTSALIVLTSEQDEIVGSAALELFVLYRAVVLRFILTGARIVLANY